MGAAAHSIRRWLFKLLRTPQTRGRCYECGKALTFAECTYYGTSCERCEGVRFEAECNAERHEDAAYLERIRRAADAAVVAVGTSSARNAHVAPSDGAKHG